MKVQRHAAVSLIALTRHLPVPASVIIKRLLEEEVPNDGSFAFEVCRIAMPVGTPDSSNGDSVVVIVRHGVAITAMLRRSWNQPFTARALRVDGLTVWTWDDRAA